MSDVLRKTKDHLVQNKTVYLVGDVFEVLKPAV